MIIPPLGICLCGYPSWLETEGVPNHSCCAVNGPDCMPCRISREEAKKRVARVRRLRH